MNLTCKEFLEYLENNFDGYQIFMDKAAAYRYDDNGYYRTNHSDT